MNGEIDHTSVDWRTVEGARYVVTQHLHYAYPGPIRDLRHRLIITPPMRHGNQRRVSQALRISPQPAIASEVDLFGNTIVEFSLAHVPESLNIEFETTVERTRFDVHRVERQWVEGPAFREPTRLTQPDGAIARAAQALRAENEDDLELAAAINTFVYSAMTYEHGVTDVTTDASLAFALRAGVCQDYAHVMIAIAKACGLAARYVSGHLLGEGGTHAWVEVLLPAEDGDDAIAWPFDPTHNRRYSMDYIVVAVGRDYGDVAPTSGSFSAPHNGVLSARKTVRIENLEYAAHRRTA